MSFNGVPARLTLAGVCLQALAFHLCDCRLMGRLQGIPWIKIAHKIEGSTANMWNTLNACYALSHLIENCVSFRHFRESASARTKMNSFGQGTFTDNEIFRNRLAGIEVRESGHPKIIRNKIYGHESSGGVYVHHYGRADLEKNDVYHNSLSVLQKNKMWIKYAGGLIMLVGYLWEGVCVFFFSTRNSCGTQVQSGSERANFPESSFRMS